jgi:hypothetical protein
MLLGTLAFCVRCASGRPEPPLAVGPLGRLPISLQSHVVVIVMENARAMKK